MTGCAIGRYASALLLVVATVSLSASPGRAALLAKNLATVGAAPTPGARLPLEVPLEDDSGEARPLAQWLEGKPGVWVLADFTCQSLCSPVLRTMTDALAKSGLVPGKDFNVRVVGLDPKDSAADARTMKDAQIGPSGKLAAATRMLRGNAGDIARIAQALGFHYVYDPTLDQYAHPAAVFTITADGRVGHALSGLSLDPQNLRLAIVDAGRGRVGTIADHVRLLCYGFDPTRGRYNFAVGRALSIGGGATLIFLVGFLGIMFRRERPAR